LAAKGIQAAAKHQPSRASARAGPRSCRYVIVAARRSRDARKPPTHRAAGVAWAPGGA